MRRSSSWIAVLPSLVIPVCLGLMMYLALAYSINQSHISNDTVLRYLTGHPVSKVTVGMFFVGLASLFLIASNVFEQFRAEKKITLGDQLGDQLSKQARLGEGETTSVHIGPAPEALTELTVAEQATQLGKRLSDSPKWLHSHYLWQRLQNGLYFAYRTESTEGIEDELKYLADLDLDQQQQRYSLVQILIWATPMLGFLGTVLGISQALGGIDVGPDNNLQTMMDGLRGNLYIAFDTTALALILSMLMMFGQFLIDRFETQLLRLVDQRAQGELNRHLPIVGKSQSGSGSYQELAENIVEANRQSTEQQTEIWKKTIRSAEQAWAATLTDTNLQVQDNMSVALDENVANLAHYLGESIDKADNAMAHRWQQWQVTLSDNARLLTAQQNQLSEQTQLLHNMISENEERVLAQSVVVEAKPEPVEAKLPQAKTEPAQAKPAQAKTKPVESEPNQPAAELAEVFAPTLPLVGSNDPSTAQSSQEDQPEPLAISRSNSAEVVISEKRYQPPLQPANEQIDSLQSSSPRAINFQSYLDNVLNRSAKPIQQSESLKGQRGTKDEIVLPFRFVSPNDSQDSASPRSNEAA